MDKRTRMLKDVATVELQAAIQAAYARQTLLLIATAGLLVVASLVILLFNFKLGNRGQPAEPLG